MIRRTFGERTSSQRSPGQPSSGLPRSAAWNSLEVGPPVLGRAGGEVADDLAAVAREAASITAAGASNRSIS